MGGRGVGAGVGRSVIGRGREVGSWSVSQLARPDQQKNANSR